MTRYIIVTWPETQELMEHPEFDDHAYLINDMRGLELYGPSSYFVEEDWLKKTREC